VAPEPQSHPMDSGKPDQSKPACTVVICTRNRPAELSDCLEAVVRLNYEHFDVLVVDNSGSDHQVRETAARWGARYIVEPKPGLSRARNSGARACSSEILAFLDDDSIPEQDWLANLAREFIDPSVMAVTGRADALSVETEAERLCAVVTASRSKGHGRYVVDRRTPNWFQVVNFGGVGDGMNMAFRRKAFEVWPGFDERLGRGALIDGGEEHYAFFSLLEAGYRVVYTPHAVVRHPYPRNLQELHRRNFQDFASAAGYITLMLVEQPHHRRALVRYVFEGLRSTPRLWRNSAGQSRAVIVSGRRKLLAWLSGPLLYVRTRLKHPVNGGPFPLAQCPAAPLADREPR